MSRRCYVQRALVVLLVLAALQCDRSDRASEGDPSLGVPDPDASQGCMGQTRCSRDLRALLDACDPAERVLEVCSPDRACKDGACVPACDAAGRADSIGCEFRAVTPEGAQNEACFAIFASNTWSLPARLELSYAGQPLDVVSSTRLLGEATESRPITYLPFEGELAPGQTAILFLSQSTPPPTNDPLVDFIPCPKGIPPAVTTPLRIGGTGRRQSFGLRSSVPITAYSIYPYGGGRSAVASASLLFPVQSWGNDYLAVSPWERVRGARPGMQLVAAEDATTVTVRASVDITPAAGVEGAAAGSSASYTLSRGEVLQVVQGAGLDGSLLSADKPIGYFATHECMMVPSARLACDMSNTQLAPTKAWGARYAAAPPPPRGAGAAEAMPWRIVAARNGTRLRYRPFRPMDAPETLDGGHAAVFSTGKPFVVESQDNDHPIALYEYMAGAAGTPLERGDPEFVPVVPTDQYLDRYVFLIDPTYEESAIVVVRHATEGAFPEVTLDCSGPVADFRLIDATHETAVVRFDAKRGQPGCGVGRHEISATGPFSITVWGLDFYSSYGYPGGLGLRPLNSVRPDPIR